MSLCIVKFIIYLKVSSSHKSFFELKQNNIKIVIIIKIYNFVQISNNYDCSDFLNIYKKISITFLYYKYRKKNV